MKALIVGTVLTISMSSAVYAGCEHNPGTVPDGRGYCVKSEATKRAEAKEATKRNGTYGSYGEKDSPDVYVPCWDNGTCTDVSGNSISQ